MITYKFQKYLPTLSRICLYVLVTITTSGCGSYTGIPSHGGGKRFAIEQELVSASVRASIKDLDVSNLKGKAVSLYINSIGDQGAGTLLGGRYSVTSLIRGESINSPVTQETSSFPLIDTQSSSESSDGSSVSSQNQVLTPYPTSKKTEQSGEGTAAQVGIQYKGLGSYTNSDRAVNKDIQFLSAALQTYLYLKGLHIVPPSEAEVDLYVNVDVFGTIRSRVEWFFANNEILRAKTAIELLAVDHMTGQVLIPPQVSSYEAEYNEQYVLWAGPVNITKYLYRSDGLLCDYTDTSETDQIIEEYVEKDVIPSYPFQDDREGSEQ